MEHSSAPPGPNQDAHVTAHPRTSTLAGMSEGAPAASTRPSATLVEMERELTRVLIEYDDLEAAWPKEPGAVARAEIGRQVEDALGRIYELHRAITRAQAETLPDAAVQLRRLAVLLDVESVPATSLQAALEGQNETAQRLLASALAAVEAADVPRPARSSAANRAAAGRA